METNKRKSQERRQSDQGLREILEKLNRIEAYLQQKAQPVEVSPESIGTGAEQQVLMMRLDHLTLKRHAVLTATLGGVGYDDLATIMNCSQTTIKLHLKGALNLLDIPSRTSLLASHRQLLDLIPDKFYQTRYGISKRWWMETQSGDLMSVLTTVKPTNNQYQSDDS